MKYIVKSLNRMSFFNRLFIGGILSGLAPILVISMGMQGYSYSGWIDETSKTCISPNSDVYLNSCRYFKENYDGEIEIRQARFRDSVLRPNAIKAPLGDKKIKYMGHDLTLSLVSTKRQKYNPFGYIENDSVLIKKGNTTITEDFCRKRIFSNELSHRWVRFVASRNDVIYPHLIRDAFLFVDDVRKFLIPMKGVRNSSFQMVDSFPARMCL